MEAELNSLDEQYFFDMQYAFDVKNITPHDFRKISASDWSSMKQVRTAIEGKIKLQQEKLKMEAQVKAEMQGRWNR